MVLKNKFAKIFVELLNLEVIMRFANAAASHPIEVFISFRER